MQQFYLLGSIFMEKCLANGSHNLKEKPEMKVNLIGT